MLPAAESVPCVSQYHSNVLNYFAQLVGSQLCTQCLLFLTEIRNTETQ